MKSNSNSFCKKNIILENSLNTVYKKNCKPFLISSFLGASLLIGSGVGTAQAGIFGSLFASNDSEETSSSLRTRLQTKRDELRSKLGDLRADGGETDSDLRTRLQVKRDELRSRLDDLRTNDGETGSDLRARLQAKRDELRNRLGDLTTGDGETGGDLRAQLQAKRGELRSKLEELTSDNGETGGDLGARLQAKADELRSRLADLNIRDGETDSDLITRLQTKGDELRGRLADLKVGSDETDSDLRTRLQTKRDELRSRLADLGADDDETDSGLRARLQTKRDELQASLASLRSGDGIDLMGRLQERRDDFRNFVLEDLLTEDGRLANLVDRLPIDGGLLARLIERLPTSELSDNLLPQEADWQGSLLGDLSSRIDLPYTSIRDFLTEQDKLRSIFEALKQLPASVITIATPIQGTDADFLAVAAATSWANEALHQTEIGIEYLSSHLGASFGLGTVGGIGQSIGVGATTGAGASAGIGVGAVVGTAGGISTGIGLNLGTGGSISLGGGATLGIPITLNDVVTNGFNLLRERFWRVNTVGGDQLKTISPILVTVGNPDQNPQTARLNDQLPVYFSAEAEDGSWFLTHRDSGDTYKGHVGIISLSSSLEHPDFNDGMIGIDKITMLMAGTDKIGMAAIAKMLQMREDSDTPKEVIQMFSYFRSLITRGMNIDSRLDRLRHFTDLSKATWSQSESPFLSLPKQIFESSRERIHNRIEETHIGQALQRLSTSINLREKIDSSWIANAVLKPDMLEGTVLATTEEDTGSTDGGNSLISSALSRDFLLSNPAGISLIVTADDDGNPQNIEIVAN